jgi:hypothetical protein
LRRVFFFGSLKSLAKTEGSIARSSRRSLLRVSDDDI